MDINEELRMKGWHLSAKGLEICKEGLERITTSAIIQKALNIDIKTIGAPSLSEEIQKGKIDTVSGLCVLQIQKLKNVASSKYETSNNCPMFLRLLLTDGHVYVNCLQWGVWKSITFDTPPGTKIFFKNEKVRVQNGFLLLNESQFTVLGGQVAPMIEKWELSKQFISHGRRNQRSDEGPPPWIPFGKAIDYKTTKPLTGNFKSLESAAKKEEKEDVVFKQQRMASIAEISRSKEGKRKVFGGGKDLTANENHVDSYSDSYNTDRKYDANNSEFHRKSNFHDNEFSHNKPMNSSSQNIPYNTKYSNQEQFYRTDSYQGRKNKNASADNSCSSNTFSSNDSKNVRQHSQHNPSTENSKSGKNITRETQFYRTPPSDFYHHENRPNVNLFYTNVHHPQHTIEFHNEPYRNIESTVQLNNYIQFAPEYTDSLERNQHLKPHPGFPVVNMHHQSSFNRSSSNRKKVNKSEGTTNRGNPSTQVVHPHPMPINTLDESHFPNLESSLENNHFSGVLEFRRGGNRPFIHRNDENYQDPIRDRPPRQAPRFSNKMCQPSSQRLN